MGQRILEVSTLLLSYWALAGPGKVALVKLGFSWICMLWSDLPVPLCGGAVTDALHALRHHSASPPRQDLSYDKDFTASEIFPSG